MNYKIFTKELIRILTHVAEHNIYGSVEIFFENGKVTQITQRIINKIHHRSNADNENGKPKIKSGEIAAMGNYEKIPTSSTWLMILALDKINSSIVWKSKSY